MMHVHAFKPLQALHHSSPLTATVTITPQGVTLKKSLADVAKSTYDGALPITRCLCHGSTTLPSEDIDIGHVAGGKLAE
jgi:hypothetical protein